MRLQLFLICLCFGNLLFSQTLRLQVLAGNENNPASFANVTILPGYQTTLTDVGGYFTVKYGNDTDTLVIQSIGCKVFMAKIGNVKNAGQIYLEDVKVVIEDVTIQVKKKKKRNRKVDPAYLLHQAIVAKRDSNNFKKGNSYSCDSYNRIEVDVNNVTESTRRALLFRPISFLFDDVDSISLPKKFVPILFSESATVCHRDKSGGEKEIIKGSKVSGLDIPSLSKFTGSVYMNYNVYNDYMNIFQKSFVSPLGNAAWLTYNYYITDSIKKGDTTLYRLHFIPRRRTELAFKGMLWTDDKSFAIHSIHLQILKTANLNFINNFELDMHYSLQPGGWVMDKEKILMDVTVSDNVYGFYVKKETNFTNYRYPVSFDKNYFTSAEKSVVWDSIAEYGDLLIDKNRPIIADTAGNAIYLKMDSVMNTPYMKFLSSLSLMYYSGYYPFKYVELGPYYSLYSFNPIEGNRFRIGGGTMTTVLPKTQLYGHLAYGTKDKKYKGEARLTHFFNLKKWSYFRIGYLNDYSVLSSSDNAFAVDNIFASLSRRVNPRFTHLKRYNVKLLHSWYNGVDNYIEVKTEEFRPIGSLIYQQPDLTELDLINLNTVTIGGRFALDEKFVHYGFRRFSLKTRKPMINYSVTRGFEYKNRGYNYTKAQIDFNDKFYLGFLGYIKLFASVGKVWGKLPYPMLINHAGNGSYYLDKKAFALMDPFEFVSDEQVSLFAIHHFNGMIFNQIPFIKRFHWRSLMIGRAAFGKFNSKHEEVVILPTGLSSLTEPYVEVGVGIENILKMIRVDFVWRTTNIGSSTQRFGINIAIEPRL